MSTYPKTRRSPQTVAPHLPLLGDYPPSSELPIHFTQLLNGTERRDEFLLKLAGVAEAESISQLTVRAVIPFAGRVLLLKHRNEGSLDGTRELPNGLVEPGESLAEALVRAVQGATGLHVVHIRSYLGSLDDEHANSRRVRQYNFVAKARPTESVKLVEHETHVWAKLGKNLSMSAADQAAIGIYLAGLLG